MSLFENFHSPFLTNTHWAVSMSSHGRHRHWWLVGKVRVWFGRCLQRSLNLVRTTDSWTTDRAPCAQQRLHLTGSWEFQPKLWLSSPSKSEQGLPGWETWGPAPAHVAPTVQGGIVQAQQLFLSLKCLLSTLRLGSLLGVVQKSVYVFKSACSLLLFQFFLPWTLFFSLWVLFCPANVHHQCDVSQGLCEILKLSCIRSSFY